MPWLPLSHREAQTNAHRVIAEATRLTSSAPWPFGNGGVHIAPEYIEHTGIDTRVTVMRR